MATLNERIRSGATQPVAWIEQGVKFLIVGLMNTGVDLGLYFLLTRYVPALAEMNVAAKGISYASGVINSYVWNRSWTFRSEDRSWKTFTPFVLTNLIGLTINAAIMWFALQVSLPEILALLSATSVVLLWNFIMSKVIVFRR
jgi:putative flippase GtrA